MANQELKIIDTRLGKREVQMDKVIRFPRGIIGFENMQDFTLLQIQEGAPLHVLQSMDNPGLGLLVADPFAFISDYTLNIGDVEQELLRAKGLEDLMVLVTTSIPPGKPEETALNLTGPIVINFKERIGMQVPQVDGNGPSRVYICQKEMTLSEAPGESDDRQI